MNPDPIDPNTETNEQALLSQERAVRAQMDPYQRLRLALDAFIEGVPGLPPSHISSRLHDVLWSAIDPLHEPERSALSVDICEQMENDALEFIVGRTGFKPSFLDAGPARNPCSTARPPTVLP